MNSYGRLAMTGGGITLGGVEVYLPTGRATLSARWRAPTRGGGPEAGVAPTFT